jgi:tripartite-type tricarboxylate transporter receptor subunit TctC
MTRLIAATRRQCLQGAALLPMALIVNRVLAQNKSWPEKPIRLVLGYPTGGAADATARPLQPKLEAALGQSLVIDYRPGAGATIAVDFTAKAPADGYTLHLVDSGPLTILPNGKKLNYDPLSSLTPIGMVNSGGAVIVVNPTVPVSSLAELVALAKATPGGLTYGTSGVGGGAHLAAELLQSITKAPLSHVPYKGGAPALVDLIGGQIPVLFSSLGSAMQYIHSGRIKPIAVTSLTRSGALPNVPTVAEQGIAGYEATVWFGLVGPAGLPADIVGKLNKALNAALSDPGVAEAMRKLGYEPISSTPQEFADRIRVDLAKWNKVIKDAKIQLE